MAFARLALFPGGTEENHQAIVEGLGYSQENADGRVLFAAGPVPDGWQIIQIWDSQAAMEKWIEDNLGTPSRKPGAAVTPRRPASPTSS